jgi:hypothetical protein
MRVFAKTLALTIVAAGAFASSQATAQTFETITTTGGKPVRVMSAWNCRTGSYPGASGSAGNGTIEVRKVTQNRCGNAAQPVEELWYTPNRGFRGDDTFNGYSGTGRVDRKIVVK